MDSRNFFKMLEARWAMGNFVCVGLDSEITKIPEVARRASKWKDVDIFETLTSFNRRIVEATFDLVCAYKPNIAFYEMHGDIGIAALERTIEDIQFIAPDVPVILDAKRGDIGSTNMGYVTSAFDIFMADAITVHPYLGAEALAPFLAHADKGIFVLCRTSNPGAGEFQDLPIGEEKLYHVLARHVAQHWNKNGNCALVVGATYPEELADIRGIVGSMPILILGIGAQGGDVAATVRAGRDSQGQGMIINASRSIIFASSGADFVQAARNETQRLRDEINRYRHE